MLEPVPTSFVVGIFVGGRGARLGGVAKGNLSLATGETLIERLVAHSRTALPAAPIVLVGSAGAYERLGIRALPDDPAGVGPLGGLRALILHARERGAAHALALSCDLPYLEAPLIARLANEAPAAAFLAPRDGELWYTLVARYATAALPAIDATLAAGEHALQRVVSRLGAGAVELSVAPHEHAELRDWDVPADAPH